MFPSSRLLSPLHCLYRAVSTRIRRGAPMLLGLGLLACFNNSFAGNADITIDVTPIPTQVSVGRGAEFSTYAAYTVTITSKTTNVINGVRFDGETKVCSLTSSDPPECAALVPAQLAPYVETLAKSSPNIVCGQGLTTSKVHCEIGQMTGVGSPGSTVSFVLLFSAPANGSGSITYPANSRISFVWDAGYSNGSTTSSSTPQSFSCNDLVPLGTCFGSAATSLITTDAAAIKSEFTTYIPSFGFIGATGNGFSALSTDLAATATTKLAIPAGLGLSTAQVAQQVTAGGLTSATTTTIVTKVVVPNNDQTFSNFVTIELRRDASTIQSGAKIANAQIVYTHDETAPSPVYNIVPPCINGNPALSSPPVCIFGQPVEFTKKTAPTLDDIGDWLFVIRALENGAFRY